MWSHPGRLLLMTMQRCPWILPGQHLGHVFGAREQGNVCVGGAWDFAGFMGQLRDPAPSSVALLTNADTVGSTLPGSRAHFPNKDKKIAPTFKAPMATCEIRSAVGEDSTA